MKIAKYLKNLFINLVLYLDIFYPDHYTSLQKISNKFTEANKIIYCRLISKICIVMSNHNMVTIAKPYLVLFTYLWVIENFINPFNWSISCCLRSICLKICSNKILLKSAEIFYNCMEPP